MQFDNFTLSQGKSRSADLITSIQDVLEFGSARFRLDVKDTSLMFRFKTYSDDVDYSNFICGDS